MGKLLKLIVVIVLAISIVFTILMIQKSVKNKDCDLLPEFGKIFFETMTNPIEASKSDIASVYDPIPEPINVTKDDLRAEIEQIRNSIFFISYQDDKQVNFEMDNFVIPNGEYAYIKVEWKELFDIDGKNIFNYSPKADKRDQHFNVKSSGKIYKKEKAKSVIAVGQAKMDIPTRFISVTLSANQIASIQKADGLSVELISCDNDVANMSIWGDFEKNRPIVVCYDSRGNRLKTIRNHWSESKIEINWTVKANGKIAKIVVFLPIEYTSESFQVKATSEPECFGEDAWNARSSRYIADQRECDFEKIDLKKIKSETKIIGGRKHALYGFNDPEILVCLPKLDNSCFVKAEIIELELFNSKGEKVKHKIDGDSFDYDSIYKSFSIVKSDDEDETPVEYCRSVGKFKILYPMSLKIVTLTTDEPKNSGLKAWFKNSKVMISGLGEARLHFAPDKFSVVRGYDAQGRRLKKLSFSGFEDGWDGIKKDAFAFWGIPVKLDVLVPEEWVEFELPFDIPAAKKLPEKQRGLNLSNY